MPAHASAALSPCQERRRRATRFVSAAQEYVAPLLEPERKDIPTYQPRAPIITLLSLLALLVPLYLYLQAEDDKLRSRYRLLLTTPLTAIASSFRLYGPAPTVYRASHSAAVLRANAALDRVAFWRCLTLHLVGLSSALCVAYVAHVAVPESIVSYIARHLGLGIGLGLLWEYSGYQIHACVKRRAMGGSAWSLDAGFTTLLRAADMKEQLAWRKQLGGKYGIVGVAVAA